MSCTVSGHFSVASKDLEITTVNPRHNILKARIDKHAATPVYRSAVFVINYQQEEVELRDAIAYTLRVPLTSTDMVCLSTLLVSQRTDNSTASVSSAIAYENWAALQSRHHVSPSANHAHSP